MRLVASRRQAAPPTLWGMSAIARVQVVWAAAILAKWAFTILVALYAYDQGGVAGIGVAALVRSLPSAVAAPYVALLVDRSSRVLVLRWSCAARVASALVTALAVQVGAPLAVVLAAASALTVAETAHRPAQAALLPRLARTPGELATANVVWSVVDNAGFLVGSLLVGVLVAASGLLPAFWTCAALFGLALAGSGTLRRDRPTLGDEGEHLWEGVRIVGRDRRLRLLIGSYTADLLVQGVLDVLLVIAAIELLGLGDEGAGWLSTAWGVGGVLAGVAARVLLRRGRIGIGLVAGFALVGVALVTIGLVPQPAVALGLLVVAGVGFGLIETADLTLTQRLVPPDVLGRVYGVQEVIDVATTAVGGVVAAGLVALLGVDGALVAVGLAMPVVALVLLRPVLAMGAGAPVPEREFALLRELELFAPLPVATIETLALRARRVRLAAGSVVITQGERGDTFYVVDEGTVAVDVDGVPRRTEGPGDHFGEIALLRDVPRTATVRAATAVTLVAVDREEFLAGIGFANNR